MSILDHDLLVIDQVTSFLSNDFAIRDQEGSVVGQIVTEGSALERIFVGSRQLTVLDDDQTVLVRINDVPNFGRDRFHLSDAAGNQVGEVVKQFTFFSKHLTVQLTNGEVYELAGRLLEFDFEVQGPTGQICRVTRDYAGLGSWFLGHNRYVTQFAPGLADHAKASIIGAVVALDLIRAKEQRSASSS